MRVRYRPWQPVLRRWGKGGLLVAIALVVGAVAGGGAVLAQLGGAPKAAQTTDINLQKGLVGWWKLDGNCNDSTPNTNDGTVAGSAPAAADREGNASGAMSFSGTGQYCSIANSTSLQVTGSQTISLWLKPNDMSVRRNPFSKAYGGEGTMTQETNGTVNYYYGTNGGNGTPYQSLTMSSALAANQWAHLVIVRDLSNMTLTWYKNGAQVNQTTASYASATASTLPVYIGQGYTTVYSGSLDDIREYNRALSSSEVAALYNSYDSGSKTANGENALIGWWKLDGNANDSSPYANDGVESGNSYAADRKGAANSARTFNGTSDYVYARIGSGTWFGGNNPLTAMAWVYVTAASNGPVFGVTSTPPGGGWNTPFLSVAGTTVFGRIWQVNANTPLSTTVAANAWHHLAITYNPSLTPNEVFYVDGQQVATGNGTYSPSGGTDYFSTFNSGSKPTGVNSYLNTPLDDVRAYSRVLDSGEIAKIYGAYNSQLSIGGASGGTVQLGKGLVGDWPLNGNANDATPFQNDGTANSASLVTDRKGRGNSAYSFTGASGSWMSLSNSSILQQSQGTISAWIKTSDSSAGYHGVMIKQGAYGLFVNGGALVTYDWSGGGIRNTGFSVADGNWHMVTISYQSGTTNGTALYVDGQLKLTTTITVNSQSAVMALATGTGGGSQNFSGSIDDARFWDRPLSPAEVSALYQEYR